jgi:hypothetical protein
MIPFFYEPFGLLYGIGLGVVATILAVEHYLVMPRPHRSLDLQRINVAFFQLNVFVSLGLAAVCMIELVKR